MTNLPLQGRFYHGAAYDSAGHITQAAHVGSFGSGYYMADKQCAVIYADEGEGFLLGLDVTLQNPYRFKQTADMEEGEIYGAGLAKAVLGENHPAIAHLYESGDLLFGSEIEQVLTEQGYDGVFVEYEGGEYEVVAYDAARVDIAEVLAFEEGDLDREVNLLPDFLAAHFRKRVTLPQYLRARAEAEQG